LHDLNAAVLVGATAETTNAGVDVVRPLSAKTSVQLPVAELAFPSGKAMRANSVVPDILFEITSDSIRPFPKNAVQWKDDPLYPLLRQHLNSTR
jgi:C-terminal processing protease CtpA/Prc